MTLRSLLSISAITALGLILLTAGHAQQGQEKGKGEGKGKGQPQAQQAPAPPKPMKEALVGAWRLLIVDAVNPDNTQTPLYGPNPAGTLIFAADGQYSLQIIRTNNRVKFAANDRLKGTADENKAAVQGSLSHFGTWSVDEGSKTLTFRIESSSFPNWDGTTQKRTITGYNQYDVLTYTTPMPTTGTLPVMNAWKWIP
jgi:Lipocalin-like domain